jgi:hypothetical protein
MLWYFPHSNLVDKKYHPLATYLLYLFKTGSAPSEAMDSCEVIFLVPKPRELGANASATLSERRMHPATFIMAYRLRTEQCDGTKIFVMPH